MWSIFPLFFMRQLLVKLIYNLFCHLNIPHKVVNRLHLGIMLIFSIKPRFYEPSVLVFITLCCFLHFVYMFVCVFACVNLCLSVHSLLFHKTCSDVTSVTLLRLSVSAAASTPRWPSSTTAVTRTSCSSSLAGSRWPWPAGPSRKVGCFFFSFLIIFIQ